MATYIPGIKDYVPQLEPFTPDYKFLSDVLDKRQDRYDKNYEQLNNLYGKIVYSDLSRPENKSKRDQFANKLSPRIQQIAELDLSLGQNVDTAKAVFKPFFEDEDLVYDMIYTKKYQDQMKLSNNYKTSSDRKIREKYWDVGVEYLNFQMKDFVNATPEEARQMKYPEYIPDADLHELSQEVLKEHGMSISDTTPYGNYLITTKNGNLLLKQPAGKNPITGETIYRNPAREFLQNTLLDDPLVQRAYYAKAYVEARKFGQANEQQFGTVNDALKEWANQKLQEHHPKQKRDFAEVSTQTSNTANAVQNWDAYAKQYGIIPDSQEAKDYLTKIEELALLNKVKQGKKNSLVDQATPTESLKGLLDKAYSAVMQDEIGKDLTAAAVAYSNVDAERSIKADPVALAGLSHRYRIAEMNHKDFLTDQNETIKFEREKILEGIEGGAGSPINFGGEVQKRSDILGTELYVKDEEGELIDNVDIIMENAQIINGLVETNDNEKITFLELYSSSTADPNTNKAESYTYNVIDPHTKEIRQLTTTWQEARNNLTKPENKDELDRIYQETKDVIKTHVTTNPTLKQVEGYKRLLFSIMMKKDMQDYGMNY